MASYDDPIYNAAIYSDFYFDTSKYTTDSFTYRLESPLGNVLQRGKVSPKPDGTPSLIYMNRLCEPYLSIELDPTKTGLTSHPDAFKKFWLLNDETGATACTYTTIRMYSGYAPWETGIGGHFIPGEKILSDPIRPNVSKEMRLPFSIFTENGVNLPMPGDEEGYTGNTCGYYLYFSAPGLEVDSENNYTLHIGPNPSTITLSVSTNIPYHTFPLGTLFHSHPPAGVGAYYDNSEMVLWQYTDFVNGSKGIHTIYDHTDQDPPTIEYRSMTNRSGQEKTYFETFTVEPPLCNNGRAVIATLTIIQSTL